MLLLVLMMVNEQEMSKVVYFLQMYVGNGFAIVAVVLVTFEVG